MNFLHKILRILFPARTTERLVEEQGEVGLFSYSSPSSFFITDCPTTALLPYTSPLVRAFILEAKFHNNTVATGALGAVLKDHLLERISEETALGGNLALIPIPLGEKRRRERGYNQTELICREACASFNECVVLPDALVRTRETEPQTKLSGTARRQNMKNAFTASSSLDSSLSYIIVDDVVTTGATLMAALQALKKGGATRISAIALAH